MRVKILAVGAAVAMCHPVAASAQEMPNMETKRLTDVRLTVEAAHDTNGAHTDKALALRRGVQPEDYTVRPGVLFDVVQPFGRQAVFLRGAAGYDFHRTNDQLNSARVDAKAGYITPVGPCRLIALGGYSVKQSDLSDVTGIVARNLATIQSVSAAASCSRGVGFGTDLILARDKLTNSAALQKFANATTDSANLVLNYRSPALGEIGILGRYAQSDFPNRPVAGGVGDTLLVRSVGVTASKTIGTKLDLEGAVMLTNLKRGSTPVGVPSKSDSVTYNARALYRLSTRLEFEALADRAILPSDRPGKLFNRDTNGEVISRYKIGPRLRFVVGARLEDVKANADTTLPLVDFTKARSEIGYVYFEYRRTARSSMRIELRQEDRKTDLAAFDFSNTRLSLYADLAF